MPVAPAAHYLIGGVLADLDGRTSLPGLLAVGECACTGLHGANRLASNSLSECFVFGSRAARAALGRGRRRRARAAAPEWRFDAADGRDPRGGLASTPARAATPPGSSSCSTTPTRSPGMIAALRARAREESRGAHRRTDFPLPDPGLDGIHLVVGASGDLQRERWA